MSNLKPTNDFVFKKLFGEEKNVDILKDLIQSILPELKIAKVVVNKDVSLERKLITDKLGILDVMATLNDNITSEVYDVMNYEDLKSKYNVQSVPCLVINDKDISFGKKNIEQLVDLLAEKTGSI